MKISSCSLALLSFAIFSIKNHNAFPYWNFNRTQLSNSTWRFIMTYDPVTDTTTRATTESEILTYNPFTDESTTSKRDRETLTYNPYTNKSTTLTQFMEILKYDPFTDKSTTLTQFMETLIYNPFTDESTTSTPYRETSAYDLFTYELTTLTPVHQKSPRNRYNFRHRFRNPIIAITIPVKITSHRGFRRPIKSEKTMIIKSKDTYKALNDYAYIETPLHSTPMVHLNVTLPQILLDEKVSKLASPYIIRITLPRKMAPRSNTTLPHRGFFRIVGPPVNMLQDGNLAMVLGKIANQIGNAYNMSGRDIERMRHVIVVGPGGQMVNRRATPPKKTTVLTSPMVMTARLRIRPNCTVPKITDHIIYFEDYTKYFELY